VRSTAVVALFLRGRLQPAIDQWHQFTEQPLRQLGVVENLRREVLRGIHRADHRRDELAMHVGACRELGQTVVLRLLLQVLALLGLVADILAMIN
jgi:hypothetical protein